MFSVKPLSSGITITCTCGPFCICGCSMKSVGFSAFSDSLYLPFCATASVSLTSSFDPTATASITFTPSQNVNMTLVLATAKSGRDVKLQAGDAEAAKTTVGGTENAEGAYYQMEPIALTAGTKYVLTKGSAESIVMLVILAPAE